MIRTGQVVVCVSDSSPCCGSHRPAHNLPQPVVGRYYRVVETCEGVCGSCGEQLACLCPESPTLPEYGCWPQESFRPVEPATTSIFSLATTRVPEPAQ